MNMIRAVLVLSFLGVSSTLGACMGYSSLGDPFMAGAGGEDQGTGGSEETGGATTGGTGSGAAPTSGGSAGTEGGSTGTEGGGTGTEGGGTGTEGGSGSTAGTGGSAAGTGGGGSAEVPPLAPRSGAFKMLVYSRTVGFRHQDSIRTGKQMLTEIAAEQGFDVTLTETNEDITLEGLSQYEIVFFLNTSGDVFNETEQQAFEEWMTTRNGAFAGVHSATDTEHGWEFYSEVTGQYFDLHGPAGTPGQIVIEEDALEFPALKGFPNPWQRTEEWYRFNQHETWSAKPGFKILARNAADNQPIVWIREYDNYRSFYTAIGHDGAVFVNDDLVKRHLTGGILWAVWRDHLLQ
jgi:type 1 glutamine amidotransferase